MDAPRRQAPGEPRGRQLRNLRTAQAADMPALAIDLEARSLVEANPLARTVYGWPDGELEDRGLDPFVHPADVEDLQEFLEDVQAGRIGGTTGVRILALEEGHYVPTSWVGLLANEDEPEGVVSVLCKREAAAGGSLVGRARARLSVPDRPDRDAPR